jgi:hypothetical protein
LKRSSCRINDDLLGENREDGCSCLHHSWFPECEKEAFQAQWKALVHLAEEKLDDFLVKLKLLVEEKLVESLVKLGLNHDEEKDPHSLIRQSFFCN